MIRHVFGVVAFTALTLAGCGGGDSTQDPSTGSTALRAVTASNTLSFAGNRSEYKVVKAGTGFTITHSNGTATQASSTIENLRFADVTVTLTVGTKAASMKEADLRTLMELYVAFFNRVPDADGLAYWIERYKAGMTIEQIAASFYDTGVAYPELTGYSTGMTNADFVKVVYKNVLGRSGDTAPSDSEVAYWAGELSAGRTSKGLLVKTMLDSAHSFDGNATWGWVASLLDNKIAVARTFAVEQGLNYNSAEASISATSAIAAAVTPSSANTSGFPVDTGLSLGPVPLPPAGLWSPSSSATPTSGNYIYIESDAGDYIGGGRSYIYTQANAKISLSASGGRLSLDIQGDENWSGTFQGMTGLNEIKYGYYGDLKRYPFHNPVKGGLSWSGEGRGCNTLTGWFVVDKITYSGTTLQSIDLRFAQYCEGGTTALRGKIHWTPNDTTAAPAPVLPVPSGLWAPAAGSTPAFDNYVYLHSDTGDYIGSGKSYTYTAANAIVSVTATGGRLAVSINGDETWSGDFQAMSALTQIKPGYYGDLQRYPFHNPVKGGLSWSGEGRGCNTLTGWFVVDNVSYVSGSLASIDLRFEQHCEGGTTALRGKVHWVK